MAEFERVWEEIQRRAGEELRQLRGNTFTYSVPGNYVDPDRTNQHIPKEHFRRALARAPFPNTAVLQDLRGPSYLYAIVMDERIRPSWDSGANLPEVAASPRVPTTAQYPASAGVR